MSVDQPCRQPVLDPWTLRGLVASQSGRLEEALDCFAQAQAAQPDCATHRNNRGVVLLRLGRHREAEEMFRDALQVDPSLADAHRNLASLMRSQERWPASVRSWEAALRLRPQSADLHYQLADTYVHMGQVDAAQDSLEEALRLQPNLAAAYQLQGQLHRKRGRLAEALAAWQQAQDYSPADAALQQDIASLLTALDRLPEAEKHLRRVLELRPASALAHFQLGTTLFALDRRAESEAALRRALTLLEQESENRDTKNLQLSINRYLGTLLLLEGRSEEAVRCLERVVQIQPGLADAHCNLGTARFRLGGVEQAITCFQTALRLTPGCAEAHNNLGCVLHGLGRMDEAMHCFEEAIRLRPSYADAQFHSSLILLRRGDFAAGWPRYEWRLKRTGALGDSPLPRWQGEPLTGRRLLARAEQGFGDTLQFVRYAALVKERGATVVVAAPAPLVRLLRSCSGVDQVIADTDPVPPCDYQLPLLSLPGLLRTTVNAIPALGSYLTADPALARQWQQKLPSSAGFKIGIVWQGNPRLSEPDCRTADQKRSVALAHFEVLARIPGTQLFSLQKDFGIEQLEQWRHPHRIVELGGQLGDFFDTAAVMVNLDLVISVDTSAAHLAGALGVPVWTLLPSIGCWRWLEERSDSPWYPSMRLFRQPRPGDWGAVFSELARELTARLCALPPVA